MQAYLRHFALIGAALALGGILVVIMSVNHADTRAQVTAQAATSQAGKPPIDAAGPSELETATFALG